MSRIIAGSRKGHRLAAPRGDATRPTTDRVREAAFTTLASLLGRAGDASEAFAGCTFLDLFAGSGAVGLEAASRGASAVVAVEQDRRAAEVIRRNSREIGLAIRVVATTVEKYLAGVPAPVDVCWLDPPYLVPNAAIESVLTRLQEGWLNPGAIVFVERSARTPPFEWPVGLGDHRQRRYGETTLYFATEGER